VADGDVASQWDTFFDREAPLLRNMALSPALGNHEASGSFYVDAFELPADTASPERYYSVRYAGSLGVVINLYGDDYDEGSDQYNWLEQTLSDAADDPEIRHVWAFLHHSPYSSGSHGSSTSVRSRLSPLFEQYGVDMVFAGHDHHYERTTVNGVEYIVTGGGGAPLYGVSCSPPTVCESVHHYILLDIEGPRLEMTALRLDGSVLDSLVLGDDAGECSQPSDCSSFEEATCETDEIGEWQCVYGGCVYNCRYVPPEEPDAGAGASGGSGTGGIGGAGASSAGAPGAEPGVEPSDDGGCGCRMGPTANALAWAWLAVGVVGLGLRRRRRERVARR
jgi:MYXO-CTERM domain-containing protein